MYAHNSSDNNFISNKYNTKPSKYFGYGLFIVVAVLLLFYVQSSNQMSSLAIILTGFWTLYYQFINSIISNLAIILLDDAISFISTYTLYVCNTDYYKSHLSIIIANKVANVFPHLGIEFYRPIYYKLQPHTRSLTKRGIQVWYVHLFNYYFYNLWYHR